MKKITPCLWFVDHVDQAAKLYASTFKSGETLKTSYYDESSARLAGKESGDLLVVDMELAGQSLQLLNGGLHYDHTPSMSLFVTCGSRQELDGIYERLSPGGKTLMALGEYPFCPRYAFFSDKFGVHWQLFLQEGAPQKITPCILFGGDRRGRGPEAIKFYLMLFNDGKVVMDERYKKGEGGLENSVKHARLRLEDSELIVMDAGNDAPMTMNGALSLVVNCKDQAEVDRFWSAIGRAGKEIQCGWIEDQFGVSWQIVPEGIDDLLYGPDKQKSQRAIDAMLKMKKLDIEGLRRAYAG